MSDWNIENEYLYELPPAILDDFNKVMDCLSSSDWNRFASRVVRDQTDLRLLARKERRTDAVMQVWGERNGTVGELLSLLAELQLLRARDIILRWSPVRPSPEMVYLSCKTFPPLPSKENLEDNQETRPFIYRAPKPLPKPGPPPSGLESREKIEFSTAAQSACFSNASGNPQSHNAMCWPFEEVRRGTNNFSEAQQIGEGGFGRVYRATLRNTEYAVKRLKQDSRLNWPLMKESFRTEVEKLSQYRHPNIVEFAGFSVGGEEHCLLYPFMSDGCLDERLHGPSSAALSWPERVSVLLGSARAIQFLHSSSPPLIHGDVKSSNILLGKHLEPKLGDFGLARFYQSPRGTAGRTSSVAQTKMVRGTLAYLPHEYLTQGELGVEIDTYSFGVVILEVLTGRRALETDSQSGTVYLKDLVCEGEEEEEEEECGSTASSLGGLPSSAAKHIWKKHLDPQMAPAAPQGSLDLASLACRCLDRRKKKRPPMMKVYEIIEDLHSRLLQSSSLDFSTNEASSRLLDQSPLTAPPPAPPPRSLLQSLDSVTRGLSKLGPQEDTYYCPVGALSSLPPPQTLSSHEGPGTHVGSWGSDPPSSQTPCESDDSLGYLQYFSPPDPSVLSAPSGTYGGSLQARSLSGAYCGSLQARYLSESGCSRGGAETDTSQSSSLSDMASDKIVMNPAKQRFVQKMAMYKEGKIPISALLSSDGGDACNKSREPEESEF